MNFPRMMVVAIAPALLAAAVAVAEAPPKESATPPKAEAPRPNLQGLFKKADSNGDGLLSLAEIHGKMPRFPARRFAELDKNGDGNISRGELPKGNAIAPQQRIAAAIRRADEDKDGQVTLAEFKAAFPRQGEVQFKRLDTNKNGFLSASDTPKAAPAQAEMKQKKAKKPKKAATPSQARVSQAYYTDLVARHDGNADGQVSFEELVAAKPGYPRQAFNQLDSDKSGALSPADGT